VAKGQDREKKKRAPGGDVKERGGRELTFVGVRKTISPLKGKKGILKK